MKLTVPAVRPADHDPHWQEVSEHTSELLGTIDALLAESLAASEQLRAG